MGGDDIKEEKTKMEKSYFEVLGICCSSEVPLVEKILKPLGGVSDVTVIVPSKTVIVLHDSLLISHLQIVNALNKSGLEASVKDKSGGDEKKNNKSRKKRWPSPLVIASGILVLLCLVVQHAYHPLRYLALGAVALGIFPILFKAVAALRNFNLSNINILVLIAVGGSIALKDYLEAGTIVFLFTIAQWLESKASHRATSAMSSLANIVPQTAVIAETGERVNADQVQLNTILSIKPGEVIPIDGVVVHGNCDVDEKTLTGESFPVSKQIDSTVWAGTINLNGYVSVNTTALAEDCVVARMANLVEEAQNNKSKTQRIIDRCTKYYTPFIIAIALCLVIVPSAIRAHNLSEWYRLALVVLVSACPCALVLSTPVAAFCALSNAAKSGLLVKGAEHLETLAKVKIMAFDKTGTITTGEFVVADFKPLLQDDHISLHKLLYWVASIESKSSHPMAEALVEYAKSYSVEPKPDEVEEFHNFPGEGICGKIDGKDIYVGNKRIAFRAGCATLPIIGDDAMEGKSIGYIFSGSLPAGIFSLSDVCRTGVNEAIQELKSMGIKTAMLTGDSQAAAKHAQDQIGGALELVHAELLPEDKARIIRDFQNESATAMIGDGLNDAAALATADIGISMGVSGSALAMETGNIILMSNDIRKIPQAVRLARKTKRKIIENIFLSVITKTAIIVLAIMGHPLVWAAVLADAGTCLLVICNSMLLLAREDKHVKGCFKSSNSSHGHKHGSKTSHSHKHCCSGTETVEKPMHETCSSKKCSTQSHSKAVSSVSRGIAKKTSLAKDHGCCGHDDHHGIAKKTSLTKDHGCCGHDDNHEIAKKPSLGKDHACCGYDDHHGIAKKTSLTKDHDCRGHDDNHGIAKKPSLAKDHGCCGHDDHEIAKKTSLAKDHGCCEHDDDHQAHGVEHNVAISESNSHSHQHCCSANEVETKCMPHDSSSPKHQCKSSNIPTSCGDIKPLLPECAETHACCEHDDNDKLEKGKQIEHGNHGCCEQGDKFEETRHMDLKMVPSQSENEPKLCSSSKIHHTSHCHHQHDHSSVSSPDDSRRQMIVSHNNKHCHSKDCGNENVRDYITEDELNNMVKTCCMHHNSGCTTLTPNNNNVVYSSSLEVRHVGSCCKSFRKECCGNVPMFGVGFGGGGLSEIVIE